MPEQPAAEKTEQPTSRKLDKTRKQGQVPQGEELMSVVTLLTLTLMLAFLAPTLLQWFSTKMKQGLSGDIAVFTNSKAFLRFTGAIIVDSALVISPILGALCVGSILTGAVISGLNFAPAAVRLRWNSINPISGFHKLINARSMVRLLISIAKLFFVSVVVWLYLHSKLETLAALRWAWSTQIIAAIAKIILGLCIRVGIALLVIAIADTIYQKWKYIQELKMTRQEVKKERRDVEGSPEVRSRIRQIAIAMSMKRMLQDVPKANVILVNPTHVAVALRYEPRAMEAPVLVAKGADYLAEKITSIARAHGVPIVRRPQLARSIYSTVQLGSSIPQTLYVAVAEVLAMLHRLRHSKA